MNKPIRQGELIIKPVEKIPTKATLTKETKKEILSHSESGHHHILEASKPYKVWAWNGETYIEVPEIANLWHQKTGKDTHKTIEIKPGTYKVDIKEHFDYFAKAIRRVQD